MLAVIPIVLRPAIAVHPLPAHSSRLLHSPLPSAQALSKLVNAGHSLMLAQSFAKNFGLYGERVGSLSIVCKDKEEARYFLALVSAALPGSSND